MSVCIHVGPSRHSAVIVSTPMVVNTDRRNIVQQLRQFAREYGVDQVLDTAGKARVQTMVQATLGAPTLTEEARNSITDLSDKYDATWATAAEAGPSGAAPAPLRRAERAGAEALLAHVSRCDGRNALRLGPHRHL